MKIKHIAVIFLGILLSGSTCRNQEPDTPQPHIVVKDDVSMCPGACAKARELNCDEGKNLVYPISCTTTSECPDGKCIGGKCTETCEMVCEAFVEEGVQQGLDCWQNMRKCSEIEKVCR